MSQRASSSQMGNSQSQSSAQQSQASSSSDQRIYCHSCSRFIPSLNDASVCPRCGSGAYEYVNSSSTSSATDAGVRVNWYAMSNGMPAHHVSGTMQQNAFDQHMTNFISQFVQNLMNADNVQTNNQGAHQGFQFRFDLTPFLHNVHVHAQGGQPMTLEDLVTQMLDNFEMNDQPVPRNVIDRIPTVTVDQKMIEAGGHKAQCSICFDEFTIGEKVWQLPVCDHIFHRKCVEQWFSTHSTCPICRTDITQFEHGPRIEPIEDEDASREPQQRIEPDLD